MHSGFDPVALPLSLVLERAAQLPDGLALFMHPNTPLTVDGTVVVADPDDLDEWEDEPALARAYQFRYVLSLPDLRAVLSDLDQQVHDPTIEDCVEALSYYLAHDRFMRRPQARRRTG